jgi:hypothetical protein
MIDIVEKKAVTFSATIIDVVDRNRVSVMFSNPTGIDKIVIHNLPLPVINGMITPIPRIGQVVILNCPQGNYTHAEIVCVKDYDEDAKYIENKVSRKPVAILGRKTLG